MTGSLFLIGLGTAALVFGDWNVVRAWGLSRENARLQRIHPMLVQRNPNAFLVPIAGYVLLIAGVVGMLVKLL